MSKKRPSGDGLIRKRSDGRWEGRIIVGHKSDGKPIYRSVFSKKQSELVTKLNQLKERYSGTKLTEESLLTLGEWLDKWLLEYKQPILRNSTFVGYSKNIDNHIKLTLGTKRLTQLKTSDIQKLYNNLKESGRMKNTDIYGEGLSNSTVRRIHMILHEALECAVREGIIPSNPTDGTTLPKIIRKEKTVLKKDELEKLIEVIKKDEIWHDFFYTEVMTGMRRGEICALKWSDFDEANGTLKVERTLSYVNRQPVIGKPKTDDGKRIIFLPESVRKMLIERKGKALTKWIFPDPFMPEMPIRPNCAYNRLKAILKEADLPDIRFHDLRHTFISHAANSGIEPKTLAQIVGHSKANFTLDTYAHVTNEMTKNAANIVTSYITDILGEELKPWQSKDEKAAKEQ